MKYEIYLQNLIDTITWKKWTLKNYFNTNKSQ